MATDVINFPKKEVKPYYDVLLIRNDNGKLVAALKAELGLTGYNQILALATNLTSNLDLTKHVDNQDVQEIVKHVVKDTNQNLDKNRATIEAVYTKAEIEDFVKGCRLVAYLDLVNQRLDLNDYIILREDNTNPDAFNEWVKAQHFQTKPRVAGLSLDTIDDSPAWPDMVHIPLIRLGWIMSADAENKQSLYNNLMGADVVAVEDRSLLTDNVIGLIYLVNR